MQEKYINVNNLKVSEKLHNFVNDELLKDTEISPDSFWDGFDKVVHELAPKNKELLNIRDQLQKQIDEWHIKNKGNEINIDEYKKFLLKIGYLKEEGPDFKIETNNIDEEIAKHSRTTACGSNNECAICAECSKCTMDEFIR